DYVRCICVGRGENVLPIQYNPAMIHPKTGTRGAYLHRGVGRWLPTPLHNRVIEDSHKINLALGYDMNSVEFAIKDGIPYAIDFTNPAPDMHIDSIIDAQC